MGEKAPAVDVRGRTELLVDHHLVEGKPLGASLRQHAPVPREVILEMDRPWEGPGSGVFSTVFHDGERYRLYYRGSGNNEDIRNDYSSRQGCCVALSDDGIRWIRPTVGKHEFNGSLENNIVFQGQLAINFAPMLDTNPSCPPDERYKALAGLAPQGLMAFKSADGCDWQPLVPDPVLTEGAFDSHNLAFFDPLIGQYRCYSRYFHKPEASEIRDDAGAALGTMGIRAIQSCVSDDFVSWSKPVPNRYGEAAPLEQFYTNATSPCPGAEHILLSFPMRFLPEREGSAGMPYVGVSDAVMMTSRDGENWFRAGMEAWIRPSLDPRCWSHRNYITSCGILETSTEEFSLYVGEHYAWGSDYLRRYTVRRHGFCSMYAPRTGGYFVTKPLLMEGDGLYLNYSTSAVGSIRVGIVADETGWPAIGYSTEDCDVICGNKLSRRVTWAGKSDLSALSGKTVRLKLEIKEADLFALRFGFEG